MVASEGNTVADHDITDLSSLDLFAPHSSQIARKGLCSVPLGDQSVDSRSFLVSGPNCMGFLSCAYYRSHYNCSANSG